MWYAQYATLYCRLFHFERAYSVAYSGRKHNTCVRGNYHVHVGTGVSGGPSIVLHRDKLQRRLPDCLLDLVVLE